MYIEQLDKTRLLITLEHEDLSTFELEPYSISLENAETRSLLKQLLTLAAIKAGVPIKNKTLSVEALPYDSGCFLLVTIKPKNPRKIYKIKSEPSHLLFKFNSAHDMLKAVENLYSVGCTKYECDLYTLDSKYYLLFSSKTNFPSKIKLTLSEFGTAVTCEKLTKAHLDENCKLLCKKNAVDFIGQKLFK